MPSQVTFIVFGAVLSTALFFYPTRALGKNKIIILVLVALVYQAPNGAAADTRDIELIVKFKETRSSSAKTKTLAMSDVRGVELMSSDSRYMLVRPDPSAKVDALRSRLASDPGVEYVEPNLLAQALFTPNDPYYTQGRQWNFREVKASAAWNIAGKAGNKVVVAVLDTGLAYEDYLGYRRLPDFAGTAFVSGFDFVNQDSHANDDNGHGSHVAGVIAQTTNNNYGTAGLAYKAKLMPVKVLDEFGIGSAFDIAAGIRWAADNGAKVINLSLAIAGRSQTVEDAVNYARKVKKVTIVGAAGNDGTKGLRYPAAHESVISVGATNKSRQRASYSQYGNGLDLVAPGGEYNGGILQETIKMADGLDPADPARHGFYWVWGTSAAAPHVSAAAAMLIARGVTDPGEVYQALTRAARDLGDKGYDTLYGYGLLDIAAALKYRPIATNWYFAEGRTANSFDTKILIGNPSNRYAKIRATFSKPDGTRVVKRYNIRSGRQFSINIDDINGLRSAGVSTKIESINGVGIVAERAMYFKYHGKAGGHMSLGATAKARRWYLAEGNTTSGFETHILVYNPSDNPTSVKATFTKTSGTQVFRQYTIPPWGRKKIVVKNIPKLRATGFATTVESLGDDGVVVERSMYFKYRGRGGGHSTLGATYKVKRWLFAEGATFGPFDTRVVIANPSNKKATIKAEFYRDGGSRVTRKFTIKPRRRRVMLVDKLPGLKGTSMAIKIQSTVEIIAERVMYFGSGGLRGGHATIGARKPFLNWYLAGGDTGVGSDTWIMIFNPRLEPAKITARFLRPKGRPIIKKLIVPGRSRQAIMVATVPGLSDTRFAVTLSGNNTPFVAERVSYFNYNGWRGGNASIGYGL